MFAGSCINKRMDIVMLQEVSGQLDHTEEQTMALRIQVDDTTAYDPPEVVVTSSSPKGKTTTSSKVQQATIEDILAKNTGPNYYCSNFCEGGSYSW